MTESTHEGGDAPATQTETNEELRARVVKLERLVDLLGSWVGMNELDVHLKVTGTPEPKWDYTSTYRAEFRVLNPAMTDDPELTWIIDNAHPNIWDPGKGPFIAGCACRWEVDVDTADEARTAAVEHGLKVHEPFVTAYPELAGPSMPEVAA